jgi:glutaminyl-tRNA synthetase
MFDFAIREALNATALRRMAVLRPLKVVIENYPEGQTEELEAVNHPDNPDAGTRKIRFSREIFIEQEDFMESPPKKFFRLSPGTEVRLYNPLFTSPEPNATNFAAEINPNSLEVLTDAKLEPALAADNAADAMQFERQGYFCRDKDSAPGKLVFNRTVGLRDTWAKVSSAG